VAIKAESNGEIICLKAEIRLSSLQLSPPVDFGGFLPFSNGGFLT
jgi:hypothetical protein